MKWWVTFQWFIQLSRTSPKHLVTHSLTATLSYHRSSQLFLTLSEGSNWLHLNWLVCPVHIVHINLTMISKYLCIYVFVYLCICVFVYLCICGGLHCCHRHPLADTCPAVHPSSHSITSVFVFNCLLHQDFGILDFLILVFGEYFWNSIILLLHDQKVWDGVDGCGHLLLLLFVLQMCYR